MAVTIHSVDTIIQSDKVNSRIPGLKEANLEANLVAARGSAVTSFGDMEPACLGGQVNSKHGECPLVGCIR